MRSKKFLIIAGFLITWTFIVFYFVPRTNNSKYPLYHNHRLEKLEQDARLEYHKSDKLMVNLLGILKTKYSPEEQATEKDIAIIALPNNQPIQEPPSSNEREENILEEPNHTETNLLNNSPQPVTPPTKTHLANGQPIIPVLVFACNRVSISKCLDNLVKYRPNAEQFPIIVSQDCGDDATRNVILSYKDQVSLIEQPDQSDIFVPPKEKKFKGYYKIARHYGWALNNTFGKGYEYVIIVEDDLNVAPDFYEYFSGTHHLLKQDPSLW